MGGAWISVLMDLALKGTVVLAAGWAASVALRQASAAARHLAWSVAAGVLLLLPLLELIGPKWEVRALPAAAGVVYTADSVASPARATSSEARSTAAGPTSSAPAAPARWHWQDWVVTIWLAGAAAALLRLAAGLAAGYVMRRQARPLGPDISGVPLLSSHRATMPMAVGLIRPAILLPSGADEWPAGRRRMVLSHELAHIRRHDCLVQVLARISLSFYWFHPLAWMAARELIKERERASDDLVLASGVKASDYAAGLLEVARSFQPASAVAWAAVAMARPSQLEGRLLAILDPGRRRGMVTRAGLAATIAATCCLVLPLAAMRPAPQAPDTTQIGDLASETDFNRLDAAAKAAIALGNYDQAAKYYQRSLELRRQQYGEQSAAFATGLLNLAGSYRTIKQRDADALYERALPILQATLGPNHPDVATSLYHLGLRAHGLKQYEQARQLYQSALDIRGRAFGASDPKVTEVLTAMALLDEAMVDTSGAESLYQRALASADPQAPETAMALELYARLLRVYDRTTEAESLEARAKPIRTAHVQSLWGRDLAVVGPPAARAGGGVKAPTLVYKLEPSYTDLARLAKVQGTVVLGIEVGTDGRAHNIQLKRSRGFGLDEAAAEALSQWMFHPGTRDGQPVTVIATVEVNFKLL